MINKEVLKITKGTDVLRYSYRPGRFFVLKKRSEIDGFHSSCREIFQTYFKGGNFIGMGGFDNKTKSTVNDVNKFWENIEDKLGLTGKDKIQIYSVDAGPNVKGPVFVVKVPKFWDKHPLRKSLFTLLLRCSIAYNRGNLSKSISSYALARRARSGIMRFLDGYTKISRNYGYGFVQDIGNKSSAEEYLSK